MLSFIICFALLIGGYFVYGKIVENTFAPDDRETPAVRINDGVDYVVMPQWKLFLVQLLNIAGLGPIFGAMQGALWGPVVFLWITFGTIFAGGVHVFVCGDMDSKVQRMMHSYSLEESAAVERIKETDKQRKKYYSYYTGGDWEAASNYDLCLNTGTMTIEEAAEQILFYLKQKKYI